MSSNIYNPSTKTLVPIAGNASNSLSMLDDVALSSPSNGQVLTYDAANQVWKNATSSGGGGGGVSEILANKFSKGDLYSTEEKMIGQWIDGKPLYQKYTIPQDSTISVNLNKSNEHPKTLYTKTYTNSLYIVISELVAYTDVSRNEGYITINKNSEELLKMYIKTNTSTPYDGEIIFSVNNGDTLTIVGDWDGSHSDIPWKVDAICHEYDMANVDYLFEKMPNVFNYTKITDSAISIGSDTDYSTEEKIVGTWITGDPLYQKTVETNGSVPSGATLIERIVQTGYDTLRYVKS